MKPITTLLAAAGLLASVTASAATITSTFDAGNEGWLVSGDATTAATTWVATGGNPGGYAEATDLVAGGIWYFQAPAAYLGDLSGALGQTLSFDLRQTGSGPQINRPDLLLTGGGIELTLSSLANPLPLGDWVSYSVALDSSADWFVGNTAAAQTEIATVLGSLTRLRIRGEYISGPDTGGLDNVSLTVVPLPASGLLMGAALLVPLWRGRRSG